MMKKSCSSEQLFSDRFTRVKITKKGLTKGDKGTGAMFQLSPRVSKG